MNRRQFIKTTAGGAAFLATGRRAHAYAQTQKLTKFIQPLQGLGPTGIPVASPSTKRFPGSDYYELIMGEYTQRLHPELPNDTKLWGYADVTSTSKPNFRHLGGVIVAQRGRPVRLNV